MKNRHGNVYPYFVCSGRDSGKTEFTRQAMLIEDVERLIEKYYERIEVSPALRQDLAGKIHADFGLLMPMRRKNSHDSQANGTGSMTSELGG